jgi:hypothetical protein
LIFLVGCSGLLPGPTITPTSQPTETLPPTIVPSPTPVFPLSEGKIIFEIEPTRKFAGTVTGQGETAIIMANMSTGGEVEWEPFVQAVDKQKFTVITFNYLQPDFPGAAQAALVILDVLRNSGYERVACIGASLGVTACGTIAPQPEIVGIVLIAGPNYGSNMADATFPKLFIAGETDPWAKDTKYSYNLASEPKTLLLFPNNGIHGANLFYSDDREQFLNALLDFVNNLP